MSLHPVPILAAVVGIPLLALALMVWLGGPSVPPVHQRLASSEPEVEAGLGDLPPVETFPARDGAKLAFRRYPGAPGKGLAVLVHGSSGSGVVMHSLAKALSAEGIAAVAVDLRGHGANLPHGDIAYAAQLDDDMTDLSRFLDKTEQQERRVLVGHSSGGGFVLRIAGGERACLFDGYLALSPYISHDSPTNRPGGGWARAGVPRIIALSILSRNGVHAFDGLRAINFAIAPGRPGRTYWYSFRMMNAFGLPPTGWRAPLRAIDRPTDVLVGADDELFFSDRYKGLFADLNPAIPVGIVDGTNHMHMLIDAPAIARAVEATNGLLIRPNLPPRC